MPSKPNVVFVLTDDQGYPPLGCHGHPFLQTPNVDAFSQEAVNFSQFHTGTTCAPTRAGLLTGHYCNSTGVWHTIGGRSLLRADEWSLATALQEHGYRTGVFGKWHLGDDYPYRPQDRGFDEVVCHGGGGVSQQPDWWGNDYFDDTYMTNGTPQAYEGYCTDVFFDAALDFIEAHADEPFFCYISTNAPHSPFNVASRYWQAYRDATDSERYARFLGMITNIDENFGRLRRRLSELGLEENTILVFMSDNGQTGVGDADADQYNAGMRGHKGSPYEGGHRVPFMIRWPGGGVTGHRAVDALAGYIDFMPTLLDLCGVEVPAERAFHGRSLAPVLTGTVDADPWPGRVLVTDTQRVAYPLKWRLSCVMRDHWRLVNRDELYDIHADPGQTADVAAAHPDVVAELQAEYETWWDLCAGQLDADTPITVGASAQETAVLRTHDMRNEGDHTVVWNQGQVRRGDACLGWWPIHVEHEGEYEFGLRRWPREAGHAVTAGIDGDDVAFNETDIAPDAEALYRGGEALPIDTATLVVSGVSRQSRAVDDSADQVTFRLRLPAGQRHVRAIFSGVGGAYTAAYYVYVRPVKG